MKSIILYLSLIIVSLLSAGFYRAGGTGGAWWKNTKVRDLGCPIVCLGWLLCHLTAPWWAYFLSIGVMYGSLTTYNKWLSRWLYKSESVLLCSWAFTGLTYGLSLFILAWATGHWAGLIYRSVILMVTTCIWSEMIGKDWLEESGRGFLLGITLPLMLIGT